MLIALSSAVSSSPLPMSPSYDTYVSSSAAVSSCSPTSPSYNTYCFILEVSSSPLPMSPSYDTYHLILSSIIFTFTNLSKLQCLSHHSQQFCLHLCQHLQVMILIVLSSAVVSSSSLPISPNYNVSLSPWSPWHLHSHKPLQCT
jgi:hypothetical protein